MAIFPIRLPRIIFFDVDRFTSFEGNTGPYILYTIVRIKSILNRYVEAGGKLEAGEILPASNGQREEPDASAQWIWKYDRECI